MYGANAGASEHGKGGLGDHGHIENDPIAFLYVVVAQSTGEAADLFIKFAIGNALADRRIITLPDDGGVIGLLWQMAINAIDAGV